MTESKTDEDFAKKVGECKTVEAFEESSSRMNFDFTLDELNISSANLADEELDSVAGGSWWDTLREITKKVIPPV